MKIELTLQQAILVLNLLDYRRSAPGPDLSAKQRNDIRELIIKIRKEAGGFE